MNTESRMYVRVDASTSIGIGHFMRCFALAEYWRESGREATFIGQYPESLKSRLARLDIASLPVQAIHPDESDLRRTLEVIPDQSIVVLDGYHFDEPYQRALADRHRLLVIDDSCGDPLCCSFAILNQNPGADKITSPQAPAVRLLGPEYALLRSEFRRRAGMIRRHTERATRILVNMGGADEHNVTLEVLRVLLSLEIADAQIRILVGPANPHVDLLRKRTQALDFVLLVEHTPDVAAEMAWAELAITAAGTACLELAAMRLPSVLLVTAENQIPAALAMNRVRASVYGGNSNDLDVTVLGAIIGQLVESRETREKMSRTAAKLVDGNGVVRVARALLELEQ